MVSLTQDTVLSAWMESRLQQVSPESLLLQRTIIRSLAMGRPISVHQTAKGTGLSLDTVRAYFKQFQACGAEVDGAGNLTGWILSLNLTPHRLYVNGHTLYAWCALDTLFLPAMIGQSALVESLCPATSTSIQLTVTPTGVTAVHPLSTVLSIVVPGVSAVCKACQDGEVARAVCYAMHFFSSREAATQWLGPQSDVAILTVAEAWQLAHTVWIDPVAKALAANNCRNAEFRKRLSTNRVL